MLHSKNLGTDSLHAAGVCSSSACEGEDCATSTCHGEGSDIAIFSISGTIFQSQDLNQPFTDPDAFPAIEFYTGLGGSGQLLLSLEVDAFGNFYDTESIDVNVYPALRYTRNDSSTYRVYMPRPVVPATPSRCNFCHQLVTPTAVVPEKENEPKYLRINDPIISSADDADLDYHPIPPVQEADCLRAGCHGAGSANTVFTLAGYVTNKEDDSAYDLGDAAIGLFFQECDDQSTYSDLNIPRHDCQPGVAPEDVIRRKQVAKTFVEVNSRGHFYTTQPIQWGTNTYPTLANFNAGNIQCRNIQHMVSAVPESDAGNCYACHDGTPQNQPLISISATLTDAENCNPPPPPPTP